MHYYRGSSIVPIIITLLLVIVAAVVAAFFLWPVPEPKILISNVSPIPKNAERVEYSDKVLLRWEAVYERPRHGLMAEVFAGTDKSTLSRLALDLQGELTSSTEGIFSFSHEFEVDPHSQYWWKVRVYTEGGKSAESEIWTFVLMNTYPKRPELLPPGDNLGNVPLKDLLLKWNASDPDGDELVYDIYFGREPRLDEKDMLIKEISESMIDISSLKRLDYSTKYYWKVVARDQFGGESISHTDSFTTQMRADLPALSADNPRSGASDFDAGRGLLSWKTSLPLEYYLDELDFDVYLSEGQSRYSLIGTTNSTEIAVPSLKGHTTYSWYVVVRDASGKEKKSEEWIFRTSNRTPIIEMEYPNISPGQDSVPVKWEVVDPDGDSVTSEVFFGPDGDELARIASGRMTSIFLSALDEERNYTLSIRANDGQGGETVRDISITPGNKPPSISLSQPVSMEFVEPSVVSFSWFGEDPDSDSLNYMLHLKSKNDSRILGPIESQEYVVRDLEENENYSWFITVEDSRGAFARSEDAAFTTGEKSLEVAVPLTPRPGEVEVSLSDTTFSWEIDNESEDLSYRFVLGSDDKLNEIVFENRTKETSIELPLDLLSNKKYFWRVDVIHNGSETEGEVWSFTSENLPPELPELRFPVNGALEVSTSDLSLSWISSDPDGKIVSAKVYLRDSAGNEEEFEASENSLTIEELDPGRHYEWAVKVTDDGGKSSVSEYSSFVTGNQKPVITLTRPPRMFLEGASVPITIEWELDDPEGEDMLVKVFVSPAEISPGIPTAEGMNLKKHTIDNLLSGRDYLLTIEAEDSAGERGLIEVPIKTRVAGLEYLYPSEGTYDRERDFSWSYSQENSGYLFRLYDSDFNPLVRKVIQEDAYRPELPLEDGKQYYWAVSVFKEDGEYAGSPVAFTSGYPGAVRLETPVNGESVPVSGATLRWSLDGDLSAIRQRELFFGESGNLSRYIVTRDSFETGELISGRTYEWYVQLTNDENKTLKSETFRFSVTKRQPEITLISPVNRGSVRNSYVDLTWSGYSPDGDQLRYSVYFGTGENLELYRDSMQSNQIRISGLLMNQTYSWYILASDGLNVVTSETRTFDVTTPEVKMDILSPKMDSEVDLTPVFSWQSSEVGSGEYRVFIGESESEMSLIGVTSDTSMRLQNRLDNGKTYYWSVELWQEGKMISSTGPKRFKTVSSESPGVLGSVDVLAFYFNDVLNIVSLSSAGLEIVEIPYQYDGKNSIILNGDLLYVIDQSGRLSTINYLSGEAGVIDTLVTNTVPEKLIMEGGYLWILDTKSAGTVIRVGLSESGIPETMESVYRDWTTPVDLFVTQDLSRIFLADALSGIKILEREGAIYNDRTSRFEVPLDGYSRAVAEKNGVVYSGEAGIDGGLKLIDISRSTKANVGRYYIVLEIEVSGSILYASTDKGVSIVDISTPESPVILRDLELTQVDEISVEGNLLIVRSGSNMLVYDVEIPNDPVLLESREE
ncbi:MAG: hypothetical protein JW697_00410 [Kosmotogaceae bacterium]|nr:hypothetical protein [Kosmotogaceae bacterium]